MLSCSLYDVEVVSQLHFTGRITLISVCWSAGHLLGRVPTLQRRNNWFELGFIDSLIGFIVDLFQLYCLNVVVIVLGTILAQINQDFLAFLHLLFLEFENRFEFIGRMIFF